MVLPRAHHQQAHSHTRTKDSEGVNDEPQVEQRHHRRQQKKVVLQVPLVREDRVWLQMLRQELAAPTAEEQGSTQVIRIDLRQVDMVPRLL